MSLASDHSYIGPYLRSMNELPPRRGKLPHLMIDRLMLWRPGSSEGVYVFHIFDPRKPCELLGSSGSFPRAEKMLKGEIPLALEFNLQGEP